MGRYFYIVLLTFAFYSSLASQIKFNMDALSATIPEDKVHYFFLEATNEGSETVSLWWELAKGDDFPSMWSTSVCDQSFCYLDNIDKCSPNLPNRLEPGESFTFEIKVDPHNLKGESNIAFLLYSDREFSNLVAETDMEEGIIIADRLLSTSRVEQQEDLVIFPNPADNYFSIKNDNNVSRISLFNVVGKEIANFYHARGATHDISNLSRGIYLVRLVDRNNKVLKTIRLNKK
jgi:hypothetical protein